MYFKILFVCKEGLIRFDASDIHVHFVLTDAIPLQRAILQNNKVFLWHFSLFFFNDNNDVGSDFSFDIIDASYDIIDASLEIR